MNFVVLSSSRGTTFQAVLDRIKDGTLTARCLGLIADKPDRGCIDKAKTAGIPYLIIERKPDESREQYDQRIDAAIQELGGTPTETIVAALGWMFILTPWFVARWKNRIINVHPALLPKFGGSGMFGNRVHEAVLASGDRDSGITIHLMDDGVDTGKILLQKRCPVESGDTVDSLKSRVQLLEKEWYPRVLQMIHKGELQLPN